MNKRNSEVLPVRARPSWRKWRRRRFLVKRSYQLKISLLVVAVVLTLVVLLNFSLITSAVQDTEATLSIAPEFEEYLKAQDRAQFLLILLASLIFVIGVFLVSLLETHKTAGAAVNIRNRLDEVRAGNLEARAKLRKGDNLMELEQAFNRMAEALGDRNWQEIEILERLAASLEQRQDRPAPPEIAAEIRRLAEVRRQAVNGNSG